MSTTAGSIVIDLLARTGSFETDIDRANKKLKSVGTQSTQTAEMMKLLSSAAARVGGLIAGAFSVHAIVDYADAYTELENRLKLVTNSSMQLAGATSAVFSIALKTNQSLDSTAQVYQRFAQNAATLGLNQQKVAEVTETVSKAVAVSGASTAAAEAALTQFGQSLASGVFRGDEFNSVMEQTPALAQAIAKGIGVSVGELRAMAAQGKLTGSVLIDALTKARDFVDQQFNTRVVTVGQSFENLQTSITGFIGEANTIFGGSSVIVQGVDAISAAVRTASNSLVHDGNSVSAAWEMVSDRFDKLNNAAQSLSENFAGATAVMGDGTTKLADLIPSSFAESFRSTLYEIDGLSLQFNRTVAFWDGLFDSITTNIANYFANTWDHVLNGISDFVNSASAALSPLVEKFGGKPLGMVSYGGAGNRPIVNPLAQAKLAYQGAVSSTNLLGEYNQRLGLKDLNNAFDVDLLGWNNDSSSGSGATGKTGKQKRQIVYESLDQYLEAEGLKFTIDGSTTYFRKGMDQMTQYAIQAQRNIQSTLGDGLYNALKGNFSDIASSFGDMVLRMVSQAAAADISGALFGTGGGFSGGMLGNFIGSIFPGPAQGNLTGASLIGANWGPVLSLADGGYTGPGGKYEEAGIVHRGEFVLSQSATRRIGVGVLNRMNRGYADGGLVGDPSAMGPQAQAPAPVTVNLIENPNKAGQVQTRTTANGRQEADIFVADIMGDGKRARALQQAFGLQRIGR